jgi:Anp1
MSSFEKVIVVGTNSLTEAQYPAYTNHCQLWFRLGRNYPEYKFIFVNPSRMSIDRMRNMAAEAALSYNADYLLFIDDDVVVPAHDFLQKMIRMDADIAAGNVIIRGYPFDYMVFKYNLLSNDITEDVRMETMKELPVDRVIDVDAVGFSLCMIRTSLLRRLHKPYFVTLPNCTEDVYFCVKCRKAFPDTTIRLDTGIVCGHILWPEIIAMDNREAYKKYMETINPEIVEHRMKYRICKEDLSTEDLLKVNMKNVQVA